MSELFDGSSPKTLMKISEIVFELVTDVVGLFTIPRIRFFISDSNDEVNWQTFNLVLQNDSEIFVYVSKKEEIILA